MMHKLTLIKNVLEKTAPGTVVEVGGWVRSKRVSKNFAFLVLSDGSTQNTLQCVIDENTPGFKELDNVHTGGAIACQGEVKSSPGKEQSVELHLKSLTLYGKADPETYPLQKKGHSLEFLRDIAHLRPRTNTFGAVFRLRHHLAQAVHRFFSERNFYWAHTPIITSSDCEGAGEMFHVTTLDLKQVPRDDKGAIDYHKDFFGQQAHLTVSGQLEAEFMAMAMGRVYTFGPTFRAENSNTTRHLSEFWMIEPEMAFADLNADAELAADFLRYLCKVAATECQPELKFFEQQYKTIKYDDIAALAEAPFARMTYTDAVAELTKAPVKFEFPVKWGIDLQSEHERYLTDQIVKGPLIVTDYPKDIKAFYMRMNDDGKTVAAMDVLAPRIGEIIGGSQREERLDLLVKRMADCKIEQSHLEWYLDLRRFGSVPHAGFGLGFERIIQYLSGMQNIRDVIPCPRAPHLIKF